MIPDPYKKTLRIPVRLKDGHFQLFHGGKLPKIKVGAVADLVIESHYLENAVDVALMEVHKITTILPKDSILMARLSTDYCESTKKLIDDIKIIPLLGYPIVLRIVGNKI
jgi:hypothetical protein